MAFPTNSVLLNGTSQYFTRAKTGSTNLYVSGAQDFTWEGWVKFTSLPASGIFYDLYGQSWAAGGNLSFLISFQNTSNTYGIHFRAGASGNQDKSADIGTFTSSFSSGTWYHLALVYTASLGKAEWFLNGVSQGSTTGYSTSIYNGTDPVTVGCEGDFSGKLNGRFSLMRLWHEARTAAQISANYCSELGTTTNLSAEWTFDSTENDNSGNSNTLTATGSPIFGTDIPSICSGTTYNETYTEAITNTDTLIRSITRPLTQTITSTDTFIFSLLHTFTESLSETDTFNSVRVIAQNLSEAIIVVDTFIRSIVNVLTESITTTETFIFNSGRSLVESITNSDTLSTISTRGRTLLESITNTVSLSYKLNGSNVVWTHISKSAAAIWTHITKSNQ